MFFQSEIRQQDLYKTEYCRSWRETGTCRYGNKCQFAHGEHELRPVLRYHNRIALFDFLIEDLDIPNTKLKSAETFPRLELARTELAAALCITSVVVLPMLDFWATRLLMLMPSLSSFRTSLWNSKSQLCT